MMAMMMVTFKGMALKVLKKINGLTMQIKLTMEFYCHTKLKLSEKFDHPFSHILYSHSATHLLMVLTLTMFLLPLVRKRTYFFDQLLGHQRELLLKV